MDYTNTQMTALIDEWIHVERDRYLLKRRLIDGIRFEALAEECLMSPRQVKRIVYAAQEILFTKMAL